MIFCNSFLTDFPLPVAIAIGILFSRSFDNNSMVCLDGELYLFDKSHIVPS